MTEKRVVCYHCGVDREIETQSPGVIKYKICAACGKVGIRVLINGRDLYDPPETRHKKANRKPYWER